MNLENLCVVEIKTEEDAQILRELRNECRNYMTRNKDYIDAEQQSFWFKNLDRIKVNLFLIKNDIDNVGFGILRLEDDVVLLTGGVTEKSRGFGIGEYVFRFLLDEAKKHNKKIELEVLVSNKVAKKLYDKLGFVEFKRTDKVISMEYRNDTSL
jgi:ribosomal protein S18 acetylase RimI-like enzyme